jgi:hypothetical protein
MLMLPIILTTCVLHNFIKNYDCKLTYIRDNIQSNVDDLSPTTLTNIPVRAEMQHRRIFILKIFIKIFITPHKVQFRGKIIVNFLYIYSIHVQDIQDRFN